MWMEKSRGFGSGDKCFGIFNLIDLEADLYNCKRSVATWLSMFLEYSMYF
jgi:hypothetical protein